MDIAKYIRIYEPNPNDEFVAKRQAAIKNLRSRFLRKKDVASLMKLGSAASGVFRDPPTIPNSLINIVEDAIKRQSISFVGGDDRTLEMCVCTTAAVVLIIESAVNSSDGWCKADVLAVALWSGTSFLPPCKEPKLEEFRLQVIEIARIRILKSGLESRDRDNVSAFGKFEDEEFTSEAFRVATTRTVDALRHNAALDREEIDLLWWVLANTSNTFKQLLTSLSPEVRAVTTGVELGALMRRLPSQSHHNLSMRDIDEGEPIQLAKLLEALGEERFEIAATFKDELLIDDVPFVFPLLWAVRTGECTTAGANQQRSLREWCARALLERAVLRVNYKNYRMI